MDYRTKITEIGALVEELMEQNILIVFNDNAPDQLKEIAVLHTIEEFSKDVTIGDVIIFGEKDYVVTAVGEEANHTLRTSGHCTFSFNGSDTVSLPGHIEVTGNSIPAINVGDCFEILFT